MNAPRDIPAGKILINDNPARDELATSTELLSACHVAKRRTYKLVQTDPGYVVAGSTCRWQNGSYAVLYDIRDERHGQHFKTENEARERFAIWTA